MPSKRKTPACAGCCPKCTPAATSTRPSLGGLIDLISNIALGEAQDRWSGDLLRQDGRWQHGVPPANNANYAWIQHFLYHLAPNGRAGFVLAKGALTSKTSGEGDIRQTLVEAGLVECIVNLPAKLFLNTQIPASLWFLRRRMDQSSRLVHSAGNTPYEDIPGFCKAAPIERVRELDYVLTPGRYVGLPQEEDDFDFAERFAQLRAELAEQLAEEQRLNALIAENLAKVQLDDLTNLEDLSNVQSYLARILAAEDHILGLEDGRTRFINEVTALSKAFAIAVPHEQAMAVKEEVAFFQAVKARLTKFDRSGSGRTDEELETAVRQVIDKALVSNQVIDIFDAAGLKKPDISILSDEFLMEIRGMKHKNIPLETLKKLLADEIKARARTNLVQSKKLEEMLEAALRRYHNKAITSVEVIEELIELGKTIRDADGEAEALGLSTFEYAFYTAVANNDSARELMQQEKLRELAVALTERVHNNTSIDWTLKESVRAKLRVIVKRTLRRSGYPPDMEKLATETVLKQAELIAEELTNVAG